MITIHAASLSAALTRVAVGGSSAWPRRVLYLDHTARYSGGEIALLRLIRSLDRSRVSPVVVLGESGPLADALRDVGVETHVLPLAAAARDVQKDTLNAAGILRKALVVPRVLAYAVRVGVWARRVQIDVIHTNSLKSDIYGALAGRLASVPVVWHVHDRIDAAYLPAAGVRLFRLLARCLPSFVIANSQSTMDTLGGAPPGSPRRVVHGGLTDEEMAQGQATAASRASSASPRALRVGIVGRLASWKGQHVFLDAAAGVLRRHGAESAEFVIVGAPLFGEADYETALHEQARRLGIEAQVRFLGFRSDIPAVLRELDVLVHASTAPEPFGQVVLEGMATGLPVIGTDAGGVREILADGETGLLVPMGDADALAAAIGRLLDDYRLRERLGRAACEHASTRFRVSRTARAVERIYEEVAGRRPRKADPSRRQPLRNDLRPVPNPSHGR